MRPRDDARLGADEGNGGRAGRGQRGRRAPAAPRRRPRGAPPGAAERLRAGASSSRSCKIVKEGLSLAQGVAATRGALERGAEVMFQGALAGGAWGGWSDILERVERPSALGAWSYVVTGTTLKRKAAPEASSAARALLRPPRRGPEGGAGARPRRARPRCLRADPPVGLVDHRRESPLRDPPQLEGRAESASHSRAGCCLIVSTSGCSSSVGGIRGLFYADDSRAAKISLDFRPERRITGPSVLP